MKCLKKSLFLLLVLVILTGSYGCLAGNQEDTIPTQTQTLPTPTVDPVKEAYQNDPASFVVFDRSTEPYYYYATVQEILQYESQYPDCTGTWFRDQLSEEALVIYNSYLYALENRFVGFEVYVEDSSQDFSYIREALSLDSPFLEQNYSHYEDIWKRPTNYAGKRIYVSMEQFTDSRWEMKQEALEKCRQIVKDIPAEYITQQEKMEYLYDYVCDNVEYVPYENMADESYFYDAVCKGETVCDGYSNMLSLLFRLIGVECCEAMGRNSEKEDGHTWVVAKLNGTFYNFDPTFEDTDAEKTDRRKYFGFSDNLASVKEIDYEEQRPKCTDTSRDFPYADLIVSSITDNEEVKKIAELAEQKATEEQYSILVALNDLADNDTYDLFFDQFSRYTSKFQEISLSNLSLRNSTLIKIDLTPR